MPQQRSPTIGKCDCSLLNTVEVGNSPPHQLCTFCRTPTRTVLQNQVVGSEVASRPSQATGAQQRQGIT